MRHWFFHAVMVLAIAFAALPARGEQAEKAAAPDPPRTGQFQVQFAERSPDSAMQS
ncbi:MAG TPA: hypothetical protein VG269_27775 [Tepidisphaeraceae bacterium]|jgi:hypothetical protein|nr:hypothetical protein [Tepidisphaeraceae bacterium]